MEKGEESERRKKKKKKERKGKKRKGDRLFNCVQWSFLISMFFVDPLKKEAGSTGDCETTP